MNIYLYKYINKDEKYLDALKFRFNLLYMDKFKSSKQNRQI